MKKLLALATVLVVAVAFPAAASASVAPGTYPATLNSAFAPGSSHVASGTPSCTVNADLSVTCPAYVLGGVGNTNATVSLTASYSATINCTNHGGNLVETHTTTFSASSTATVASTRNGQLRVPAQSVSPFSAPQVCPNPNWTPSIAPGTLTLTSLNYSLTFAGFSSPYITVSQTDP